MNRENRLKKPVRTRVGLSKLAESRLRRRLRAEAPSEPWVDAQFATRVEEMDGESVAVRFHQPGIFPPGGEKTAMKRCPLCKVLTPPNAFEAGVCLDHAEHGSWGPSPSAVAIAALQHLNLRLAESPLPDESTAALRNEIARHKKKQSTGNKEKRCRTKFTARRSGGKSDSEPPTATPAQTTQS